MVVLDLLRGRRGERVFNGCAGVSVLSWAVLGLRGEWVVDEISVVRMGIAALQLAVGFLFLFRAPLRAPGKFRDVIIVSLSFLSGAVAFRVAPPPLTWPVYGVTLFLLGVAIAIVSLVTLGRSFAVMPALRDVVVRGPYALVRHPAYGGELLMMGACCLVRGGITGGGVFVLCVLALVVRIRVEEKMAQGLVEYRDYADHVRWRLVPGIW